MSALTPKHLGSPFWMADFRVCCLSASLVTFASSVTCTFRSWETATAIFCRWQRQKLFHNPKAAGMQFQMLPFPQTLLENPSIGCTTIGLKKKKKNKTIFFSTVWQVGGKQLYFIWILQWGDDKHHTHYISINLGMWFEGFKWDLVDYKLITGIPTCLLSCPPPGKCVREEFDRPLTRCCFDGAARDWLFSAQQKCLFQSVRELHQTPRAPPPLPASL